MPARRAAWLFASANLTTAAFVVFGVFVGLPARWWPVDTAAAITAACETASAIALLRGGRTAAVVARVTAGFALLAGLTVVTLLGVTASWLSGVYGPVGHGGAIILALLAALVAPYLVVLPAAQLLWLGPLAFAARGVERGRSTHDRAKGTT